MGFFRLWTLTSFVALGAGFSLWAADTNDPNQAIRAQLQGELEDFSVPNWNRVPEVFPAPVGDSPFVPEGGPALSTYREHWVKVAHWQGGPIWHQAGTLPLVREGRPTELLGVNVFVPPGTSLGTLLLVHGYMSHAANFAYTAAFFTARGWTVTTLDLPGHGLSTGPRADVDTFAEYGDAVATWMAWVKAQGWPGPRVLIAHSLGSVACLEALRRPGAVSVDQIVFCAPLLRPAWYPLLAVGDLAIRWWVKEFPSRFGWDGYLDGYEMPVHWFEALEDWLKTLDAQGPLPIPLTVYSGDKDQVVDFQWNRDEYQRLVPNLRFVTLPGKDHLFLSNAEDREGFHQMMWESIALAGAP